jgi:DNA-binding transcriptional MerR regulator
MKINEVEKILDVPKATIRFYEKEGLILPQRGDNSYREYSDADVECLKKIIVLRKIGVPVEDIKQVLNDNISLQDVLSKNMESLHKQLAELEGALRICSLIQKKEDSIVTFDENYYWHAIHAEEEKGSRFFDIVNDVIEFEKQVIGDEFGLLDEHGKMKFSAGKSFLIALAMCFSAGLLWFFLDGMNITALVDGFFFPFVCIIISSIIGLPVFFLEKKNKKAAEVIKKIGMGLGVAFLIFIVLLMIFLDV